jgi:predicted Zn-dependent protease
MKLQRDAKACTAIGPVPPSRRGNGVRGSGLRLAIILCCFPLVVGAGSPREEVELGRRFALEAQAKLPFVDDYEVVAYVNRIGQKIVGSLDNRQFDYHFFAVRDGSINAFAVPGGYIYVYGGLLIAASNEDEVAGVLGHEVAHVHAHHLMRMQEKTQLLSYAALLGLLASVINPAIGAGAMAANQAAQLHYSREFEQEADYLGARFMKESGYDPRGMLDFFKKLMVQQEAAASVIPPYLMSHPLSKVRLTNLEAVLKQRQWDRGERHPANLDLQRVQLIVRARAGSAKDLLEQYQRYVDNRPGDGQACYLLGLAYLETGAFNSAKEKFEQAQQLGFEPVERELGRTYLRQRDLPKARELLSRAAEIAPNDPVAQLNLAKVLEAMNETEGALRAYRQTVRVAPDLREAQYGLGMLAGRTGSQGEGFYHLGIAFKLEGDYEKALSQFEKAAPLLAGDRDREAYVKKEIEELKEYVGGPFSLK